MRSEADIRIIEPKEGVKADLVHAQDKTDRCGVYLKSGYGF